MLSVEQCATLACVLDVTVPKPGNVHRGADFEDATFLDFALSAIAIGPSMQAANSVRLGETVLKAVQATRAVTTTNTNLGIVLLLSPLAAVERSPDRQRELRRRLKGLGPDDADDVFAAIRLAQPGGLGTSEEMDVRTSRGTDLLAAMAFAQTRDLVALQYVTDFELVLNSLVPQLIHHCNQYGLVDGVVETYLETLSQHKDSLIARKCGAAKATQVSAFAARVLSAGAVGSEPRLQATVDFDFWLRSDGHRRNPGTTADLVTAAMFVALLDEAISFDP